MELSKPITLKLVFLDEVARKKILEIYSSSAILLAAKFKSLFPQIILGLALKALINFYNKYSRQVNRRY